MMRINAINNVNIQDIDNTSPADRFVRLKKFSRLFNKGSDILPED
jgi:hypothetical protein